MERLQINESIKVLCISANGFPEGIVDAHEKIRSILPPENSRRFFGLSRPDSTGKIAYKAAAEQLSGTESDILGIEEFTIQDGAYKCITVNDFRNKPNEIKHAFDQLIQESDIDPNGICLEWYLSENDVRCMIRLKA